MTASCEGGQKWSRPNTPLMPTTPVPPPEPLPPPQSIYLEGALPAQSQLLVSESATETETEVVNSDPAVVLSGKMTLSLISLDSLLGTGRTINRRHFLLGLTYFCVADSTNEANKDKEDYEEEIDEEEEEIMILNDDDEDDRIEESKYTTASALTAAENDISEVGINMYLCIMLLNNFTFIINRMK